MGANFRDHRTYLVHLLRILAKKGPSSPAEIYDLVADRAGITAPERAVYGISDEGNPVYRNRIQFARQALIDAKLLIGSSEPGWERGVWALNAHGAALAAHESDDAALDEQVRVLAADGARSRAWARKASRALAGISSNADAKSEPVELIADDSTALGTESIQDLVDSANERAMDAMLDHIRNLSDRAFEYLVGTVLKAALRAESVRVTQKSRDGGIDGVLSFDDLGMRTAVFEAKRYADEHAVGRPQVDAFATAARRARADHKLFVTSSRFSPEAIVAAKEENVRLIDGTAFVELMARHGIGLREREAYVVYEVDPAWSVPSADDSEA